MHNLGGLAIPCDFPIIWQGQFIKEQGLGLLSDYQVKIKGEAIDLLTYDLTMVLFTHWEDLHLELHKILPRVHILVASDLENQHAKFIKLMIENNITHELNIDVYDQIRWNPSYIAEKSYQIIVANFPLPLMANKEVVVVVNNFMTREDISQLQAAVERVLDRYEEIFY